jgi:hypothetical protein
MAHLIAAQNHETCVLCRDRAGPGRPRILADLPADAQLAAMQPFRLAVPGAAGHQPAPAAGEGTAASFLAEHVRRVEEHLASDPAAPELPGAISAALRQHAAGPGTPAAWAEISSLVRLAGPPSQYELKASPEAFTKLRAVGATARPPGGAVLGGHLTGGIDVTLDPGLGYDAWALLRDGGLIATGGAPVTGDMSITAGPCEIFTAAPPRCPEHGQMHHVAALFQGIPAASGWVCRGWDGEGCAAGPAGGPWQAAEHDRQWDHAGWGTIELGDTPWH